MSCNVTPLKKYAEISYRVKCVTVENERVFGDVYVTQQTRELVYCPDGYHLPSVCRKQQRNLIQQTLNGPDLMELNSKRPIRNAAPIRNRSSSSSTAATLNWQKRSKSTGDQPDSLTFNCEKKLQDHDVLVRRPKV